MSLAAEFLLTPSIMPCFHGISIGEPQDGPAYDVFNSDLLLPRNYCSAEVSAGLPSRIFIEMRGSRWLI